MKWLNLCFIFALVLAGSAAWGQKKMDLEDLTIKGELHGDDRLKIIAREKNRLKNYVKYRTDFRAEIIEGLPKPEPKVSYEN
jgi:hypothetical protein